MDDIETVDYNNGTNINDPYNINLRKTLGTQLAKQIIKKYKNLSRNTLQQA